MSGPATCWLNGLGIGLECLGESSEVADIVDETLNQLRILVKTPDCRQATLLEHFFGRHLDLDLML